MTKIKLKYPARVVRFKYRIDNPLAKVKPPIKTIIGLIKSGAMSNLSNEGGLFLTIWNRDRSSIGQGLRPNFYQKPQIIGEVKDLPLHEALIWRIMNYV